MFLMLGSAVINQSLIKCMISCIILDSAASPNSVSFLLNYLFNIRSISCFLNTFFFYVHVKRKRENSLVNLLLQFISLHNLKMLEFIMDYSIWTGYIKIHYVI